MTGTKSGGDMTWRWIMGITLTITIGLISLLWASVVTDADIANFIERKDMQEIIYQHSPYNIDKKLIENQLKNLTESFYRIECKLDRVLEVKTND